MMIIDMTAELAPIVAALQALLVVAAVAIVADGAGLLRSRRRRRPRLAIKTAA